MKLITLIVVILSIALSVNTCQASEGPWEFASLYHLTGPKVGSTTEKGDTNSEYTFLFYKQKGAYADKTFDVSFGINSVEGTAGIEKAEPSAITLWKTNATVVNANDNTFRSKDINKLGVFRAGLAKTKYLYYYIYAATIPGINTTYYY